MRRRVIILSVLLSFAAAFIFAPKSSAASYLDDIGSVLGVYDGNDENFLILSSKNNMYNVTEIDKNFANNNVMPGIDSEGVPFAYHDGKFCFFQNGAAIENGAPMLYVTIRIYDHYSGVTVAGTINNVSPRQDCTFAFDGERFYMMTPSSVLVYSSDFLFEREIPLKAKGYSLTSSPDGYYVYCATSNGLIVISGESEVRLPIYTERVYPLSDGFAADDSTIYTADGESIVFDGFDPTHGAARAGDWLVGRTGGYLTAVNGSDKVELCPAEEGSFICGNGNVCGCFTPRGSGVDAEIFSADDIYERIESETSSAIAPGNSHDYIIDTQNRLVTGIEPGTTVAAFRKAVGADARFYAQNGAEKSSGVIGTGLNVVFPGDGGCTAVVFGDVTGEGSINSRDVKQLEDHILGTAALNGAYLTAADVFPDGTVDLKDAAALYRSINGKYTIQQKR